MFPFFSLQKKTPSIENHVFFFFLVGLLLYKERKTKIKKYVAVFSIKDAAQAQGPGWLWLVPMSALLGRLTPTRLWPFFFFLVQWALQGPGAQALPQGSEEPGTQNQETWQGQMPWPCAQAASTTACQLDIPKSAVGKGDNGIVLGVQLRVTPLLFLGHFLQLKKTLLKCVGSRSVDGGQESSFTRATSGPLRESVFTGATSGPCMSYSLPVLSRLWALRSCKALHPHTGGGAQIRKG